MKNLDQLSFKAIVEDYIPFHKFLNLKLHEIDDEHVSILLPFKRELIGDPRRPALHGGIISALLDAAGGMMAMSTLKSQNERLSTIDLRVDYLLPAEPKDVIATATIIRSGNRIIVTEMIACHKDCAGIIADGKGVYNVRRIKAK